MHFKCGSCPKIMSFWQMCLPLMSTVDIVNQSFRVWSVTKGLKKGLKWNKRPKCQLIIAQNWASNGFNWKHTEISQLRFWASDRLRELTCELKILSQNESVETRVHEKRENWEWILYKWNGAGLFSEVQVRTLDLN